MGDSKRMVKRKIALWDKQRGLCFWCGQQTVLTVGWNRGRQSAEIATIDHLRCKYSPDRCEPPIGPDEEMTVLACYKCNQERGKTIEMAVPLVEIRRRSGRGKWK